MKRENVARRAAQTIDPRSQAGYGPGYQTGPRTPRSGGWRIIDYPRYGRRGWSRWVPSWKLVLSLFLFGLLIVLVALLSAYAATTVPTDRDPLATAQSSSVYYADGKLIGTYPGPNRRTVPLALARISLKSFIASMSPITSPSATWLPTWMKAGVCGEGDR